MRNELKRGRVLEPGDRLLGHTFGDRVREVEFGTEDRAGYVEFLSAEAACYVFDRQVELFDRELRRAVQENKRPARFDKFLQILNAFFPDPARILIRHRAFRIAVEDLVGRLVGEDDRIHSSISETENNLTVPNRTLRHSASVA